MLPIERFKFVPVEKATIPPSGLIEHVKDHWWIVHPEKGLAMNGMTKKALAVARPRLAASSQIKILTGLGYDQIFDDFEEALPAMRKGESLGAVDLRA